MSRPPEPLRLAMTLTLAADHPLASCTNGHRLEAASYMPTVNGSDTLKPLIHLAEPCGRQTAPRVRSFHATHKMRRFEIFL